MKGRKEDKSIVATMCSERMCYLVAVQYRDATRSDVDDSATGSDEYDVNNETLDVIRELNTMFQLNLKSHDLSFWNKISYEKHNARRKRILWKVI